MTSACGSSAPAVLGGCFLASRLGAGIGRVVEKIGVRSCPLMGVGLEA